MTRPTHKTCSRCGVTFDVAPTGGVSDLCQHCRRERELERNRERYHTDPEYRERRREQDRERYRERWRTDPEYRERERELARERYRKRYRERREIQAMAMIYGLNRMAAEGGSA